MYQRNLAGVVYVNKLFSISVIEMRSTMMHMKRFKFILIMKVFCIYRYGLKEAATLILKFK